MFLRPRLTNGTKCSLFWPKTGLPLDDIGAANELISLIASPNVSDAMDLFPFLIGRCGGNIDKRIRNVHGSIQELRNDFKLAIAKYKASADITVEFPRAGGLLENYVDAHPFAAVWGDFVEKITDRTAQGLNAGDIFFATTSYAQLFLLAD